MWGRIYPHMVLLIFANVIFKASCKGNGSLTFLIDDTRSMTYDIRQVKQSVNRIMNIVFNEKASLIDNMVLVTFNDPDAEVRVVTKDRNTFKRTLDAVYAHNVNFNWDCWEPSMNGLLLALDKSHRDSYIYVFTDAPARDYRDSHFVKEMCQRKQSQIVFVLTGRCGDRYKPEAFEVYFDIAHACSGLAFDVTKHDVNQVIRTIDETIKGNKTVIKSVIVPAGVYQDIPFTIDDHTDYAIVSVSGKNVYLDIKGPSSNLEQIMWNDNGKAKPGLYVATVRGKTRTSVVIVGRTDFFFSHGFSELKPKSPGDTSPQPIADVNVHLSISVSDDHHSVKIVSAQILQLDDTLIKDLPLAEASKDFYITEQFVAPSHMFKVAVSGVVKATGKPIKRIAKIPVTPQKPLKKLPNNTKPIAQITEGKSIEVAYNSTVKLTCKVTAFPEPKITWINSNGETMLSKSSLVEHPYIYISYMDISYASKGDKYMCYTVNDVGKDSATINVIVKEPFTIGSVPSGITKLVYGTEGTITCDIRSRLPMDIRWSYVNESSGITREIKTSDKYLISASHSQLKIKEMDLDLVGKYTCKAFLKNKEDVQKAFSTRVKIDGLIAPKVHRTTDIKVTKGKTAVFECKVVSGLPPPTITWQFGGISGSKFTPISGSESVLRITNVEDKHAGKYKCVAENVAGKDEHVTTLLIQDFPKITSSSATVFQGTEGDALLRIPCVATGVPKPVIIWKLNGRAIAQNAKYSTEDGALIIRDPKVADTNLYTCEAKNEIGSVSTTFKTYIRQAPRVSGVDTKKVTMGTPASIECIVASGLPPPTITWQFEGKSGSQFTPISGSESVLRITNVEDKHAGRYKCVAENVAGKDEHVTTLSIQVLPKISSSRGAIYQGTEGDALLRIPCVATGVPKPVIIWKLNGRAIAPNAKYSTEDGALIIRDPKVADTNSYTCEAKNEVGSVSTTFKTHIHQAPRVSGVDTKKVTMGTPASIECIVASGLPPPTITWQFERKSGSQFTPISGSESVLRITNVEDKHAGRYKCVAENVAGKAEHVTTLLIQVLPKISSSRGTIYQGTEGDALLRIPCVATGVPKPVIIWKLNGRAVAPNAKYSTEDGALIIRDPKVADTNLYTCEAKNEVGSVSTTFKTHIHQAPRVSGVDTKKVIMGTPASIECIVASGLPPPTITWQFERKSGSQFTPISGSESVLRITNVEDKHAGRYKCVAENVAGKAEHVTTLSIQVLPKISSSRITIYQGTEGDALLRIPCVATGVPKPVIIWKLNGRAIVPNAKYSIEDGTLIIREPKLSDTNSYTCEAKNEVGSVSTAFKTYISQAPRVSGVDTKKVRMGTPASIECIVASGLPPPTITWQFQGKSGSQFTPISGSESVLRITNVEDKHAGKYKCVAENVAGKAEHVTTLLIQVLPKISSSRGTIYQGTEGDALLRIPCVATGVPKPVIIWKLNGRAIAPNAKYSTEDGALIIRDPKVADTNLYTCEAKNEVGSVSTTFKTHIHQAPRVSGVDTKKVIMGTPASIECIVASGLPPPTITWQFERKSGSQFTPISGSESVLRITNVEDKHAGRYKCVADNVAGKAEHVTTLSIQVLPKISSSRGTIYQGTEGDALLRIPCVATGVPKPVIIWKLNGRAIAPNAKYSTEDGALIIRDPKVADTNLYTCEAKNEVGSVSTTFKTHIHQAPRVSGVDTKKVIMGTPASIECIVASGLPPPTITWQFERKSGSQFTPISGSESVLRITNVEDKHAGRYKCVADNVAGKAEHVTTLSIQVLPKISSSRGTIYQGTEGDALLRIPCVATGVPKPVIIWKLNGRAIAPNAKYSTEDGALIIRDPKVADTNLYTCEAKNEVGSVSTTFKTHIHQAPRVSGVDTKKVIMGTPASIECIVASGLPPPTITWQFERKSGSQFTPISGSESVLRITNVEDKHAGRYKCVAENVAGKAEHVTTLSIQVLPKISSSRGTIYQGTEGDALLRIPCVATGVPKPVIIWKLNGRAIAPNAKYSTEDGALIIRDPKVADTNLYTCEAKNEVGSVSTTFKTHIHQAPRVSGVDTKKVIMGTPASIECIVASGLPPPTITWQFERKSGSQFTPISGSESVLRITNVEDKHAGRYKCVAENVAGKAEHVTTLLIQVLPKISSSRITIYQGTEGDALLRIPCVATGVPKPAIIWKLNGRAIVPNAKYSIEDGTLIIREPKLSDTNSYTCEAKNEVGSVSTVFKTYISQAPQVSGVDTKKVRMGTPASIECMIVKGEPKPNITWQFKDNSTSKFVPIVGSENALRFTSVEDIHAGNYKCVTQNNVGTDEHVTTLIVESAPRIITNSTTVNGMVGDLALRLSCDVVGIPQPVITWKLKGATITPDTKYTIEDGALVIMNPNEKDNSSYTCEAKNYIGSASATINAIVESDLNNFGTNRMVYLLLGETKKLECEAYRSKDQSIRWFKNDVNINETYIQIVEASYSDNGNYTCRVSDKHGHTQTYTYEVNVGHAPELQEQISLSNWDGEIKDILSNCDSEAEPMADVKWSFNGKVLADREVADIGISYKWGHYTCNISNVHGSVQTSFDVKSSACLIPRNLRDAQYMPLVLTEEGAWPKWETTKDYTVVKQEEKIIFSCPGPKETPNTFKNFHKQNKLMAVCIKEDTFAVDGKFYKLSDLQCNSGIQPSLIRKKVKCLTETSELIRVGYNVAGFLETYEVCFDHAKNMPLYTRAVATRTDGSTTIGTPASQASAHNWYTYPGIGDGKTERGFTCKNTLSSCCYGKSQLVNAKDFNYDPEKNSTFIDPLNAIPAWRPCNISKTSWENIGDMVKRQNAYDEFVVWSGTHTMQEKHGAVIPRYLWKVLRFNDEEAMAIVHVNDPTPTEKDIKCNNTCTPAEEPWFSVSDKYTYCCSLSRFLEAFDIYVTDIEESLVAVLDKIEKNT